MNYTIYRMEFEKGVHFGKNTLENGENTFCADTLFSALCQEAVKMGADTLDSLCRLAKEGKLIFSDAFPYISETYFVPKPVKRIETEQKSGDSKIKKAYKKLRYIAAEEIDTYLSGNYDIENAPSAEQFGKFDMKVTASIRGEEETKPYNVNVFYFNEGCGLYIIVGADEESGELFEKLFEGLSFAGIGGRRSSGLGRFVFYKKKVPEVLLRRLNTEGNVYMTMSVSLPEDDELEKALEDAQLLMVKRSGFVASEGYSDTQLRKRDIYLIKAGACVKNKYRGGIFDVSTDGGKHPVYRYAKPMFMEVD